MKDITNALAGLMGFMIATIMWNRAIYVDYGVGLGNMILGFICLIWSTALFIKAKEQVDE